MHRLKELQQQIHDAGPMDPKGMMLRAIFDHECQQVFDALCADLKTIGVEYIRVSGGVDIHFTPFQPQKMMQSVMIKHFGYTDARFPIRLPPKFWGEHFL